MCEIVRYGHRLNEEATVLQFFWDIDSSLKLEVDLIRFVGNTSLRSYGTWICRFFCLYTLFLRHGSTRMMSNILRQKYYPGKALQIIYQAITEMKIHKVRTFPIWFNNGNNFISSRPSLTKNDVRVKSSCSDETLLILKLDGCASVKQDLECV